MKASSAIGTVPVAIGRDLDPEPVPGPEPAELASPGVAGDAPGILAPNGRLDVPSGAPTLALTVLITAYDRPEFLPRAIESACRQTADPSEYEVLVVSNLGSHADAVERAHALRPGLNLRFLQVGNVSVGEMFALGIEASRGSVIGLLNDDDEWSSEKVAETVHRFDANPRLGFLKNGVVFVDRAGRRTEDSRHLLSWLGTPPPEGLTLHSERSLGLTRAVRWLSIDFNDSSISVRKSQILPSLSYLRRLKTHEDTFLFFAAAISGGDLMLIPDPLTRYRVHDNALTQADRNGGSASLQRLKKNDQSVVLALDTIRELAMAAGREDLTVLIAHDREYWQLVALARGSRTPRAGVARQLLRFLPVWSAARVPSSAMAVCWSFVRIASPSLAASVYLQARAGRTEGRPRDEAASAAPHSA